MKLTFSRRGKVAKKKAAKKAAKKVVKKAAKKVVKKAAKKVVKKAAKKVAKKAAKKVAKKAAKKPAKKKVAKKKSATKRKPNPQFMKPMNVSADLGKVVGNKPMPRTEVTKQLWAYIKKNKLQDSANKRMINADDNLRVIFGGKRQVSMFEMTKLVNKHLS